MSIQTTPGYVRTGTTADWAATTLILRDGELGYDTTLNVYRMGDGVSLWGSLRALGETPNTGWRQLTYVAPGVTFLLRRVGDRVEYFQRYQEPGNTSASVVIPTRGFNPGGGNGPDDHVSAASVNYSDDEAPFAGTGDTAGNVNFTRAVSDSDLTLSVLMQAGYGSCRFGWFTDDPWPTVLPGEAYPLA